MLADALIQDIVRDVETNGLSEAAVARLRAQHPDIHFTFCLDDDIVAKRAYLERPNFNVYLVDGREHCLKLTPDLELATGLVLAEVIDDE
jgi:hypothetical protein